MTFFQILDSKKDCTDFYFEGKILDFIEPPDGSVTWKYNTKLKRQKYVYSSLLANHEDLKTSYLGEIEKKIKANFLRQLQQKSIFLKCATER